MYFLIWLFGYLGALLLEVAVLPSFLGSWVLPLSTALVVAGIVLTDFFPGFWFAALSGLVGDFFISSNIVVSHTASALGLFFVIQFFRSLIELDEPLATPMVLAAGFAALPVGWVLGSAASHILFGRDLVSWGEFVGMNKTFLREAALAVFFVAVFSWVFIRRFSKTRERRLSRL